MSKVHRNSYENQEDHHLYVIMDKQEEDIFKFGISSDPIDDDGLSDRIRKQLNLYNVVVGFVRFFAKILIIGIKGRPKARKIEDECIAAYEKKYGRKPRGNLK